MTTNPGYSVITGPDDRFHSLKFLIILLAASGSVISPVANLETGLIVLLSILIAIVVASSHENVKSKTLFLFPDGTIRWLIRENQWSYGSLCTESWATSQYAVIGVEQGGRTEWMMISRSLQANHSFRALLSNLKLVRFEG